MGNLRRFGTRNSLHRFVYLEPRRTNVSCVTRHAEAFAAAGGVIQVLITQQMSSGSGREVAIGAASVEPVVE
jgi:hypothetical protein